MPVHTFGDWLRAERESQKVSLRKTAFAVGIDPAYLSDIERDRRVPSDRVLDAIADQLGLPRDEVSARSGRIGAVAEKYIKRNPEMVRLIRHFASENISPEVLTEITRRYHGVSLNAAFDEK